MGGGVKVWCGERAASGRVASSASSSMLPEPILAPLIKGRRPMNVYHYPSLGSIRYKKLEKVTDVRYGPPLLPISALVHGSITPCAMPSCPRFYRLLSVSY